MNTNWETYQKKFWTDTWESSPYSIQELIDEDPFVGVKFSPLMPHILNGLKRDTEILEAGCEMGQWVIYLSDCGFDITGLDFSEPIIEKLQILYPEKKFIVGDIPNFEFNDNMFDVMLSWGVMEHFIDGPSVPLHEANRILKKNGILFITGPCNNILSILLSPVFFYQGLHWENIQKIIRKA
jgi:SAM-dependent methyltransferase